MNKIYAVRKWWDGNWYWATAYWAKPNYSTEVIEKKWWWYRTDTGEKIPYAIVEDHIKPILFIVVVAVVTFLLMY